MQSTQTTKGATPPTKNPKLAAIFAAEKLYRAAIAKDDQPRAATILEVTRLWVPNARFSATAPLTKPSPKEKTVESTEQPASISQDERDYQDYRDQIDGTAIRRRAEEAAAENDEITNRYYRENPENAPTNWSPETGYDD